ncbi:MAG: cation diffusion facilitator family transporter [Chitinispirillaceae bacterium]|nr:cation diffusion facilitator family transporter [Chitinispirillaceae bacterium]
MEIHSHHHNIKYNRIFFIGILLNTLYVIVELTTGLFINSVLLISDAIHNLSDVLTLIISWLGSFLTTKKATINRTYGLKKTGILAAFINSVLLFTMLGAVFFECVKRFFSPPTTIETSLMWKVAVVGIMVNFGTALLFYKDQHKDINFKSAFLHMVGDGLITVGVAISAFIIKYTSYYWIDPTISIIIVIIIFINSWKLFYQSLNMILDSVPENIDVNEVKMYLESISGVKDVHDLHIWAMSTREVALTAHLVKPETQNDDEILLKICRELNERFHISHTTIQFEREKWRENCNQISGCC